MNSNDNHSGYGIQALIDSLRNEGVDEGRARGTKIVEDAESRAEWMIQQAREEAADIVQKARKEAGYITQAGEEALHLAFRDIKLKLKDLLSQEFALQLKSLIQLKLSDPDTLTHLLLELTAVHDESVSRNVTVYLPEKAKSLADVRQDPSSLSQGPLAELISDLSRQMLEKGIRLELGQHHTAGVLIKLQGEEGVTIDYTDNAINEMLLHHLHPRFRAILEGLVR